MLRTAAKSPRVPAMGFVQRKGEPVNPVRALGPESRLIGAQHFLARGNEVVCLVITNISLDPAHAAVMGWKERAAPKY